VLPEGDQLKGQIAAVVAKLCQSSTGAARDPDIDEMLVATWRAVEAVKNEASEESTRIIEEYRRVRLAKMEHILSLGTIAEHEFRQHW
jgi:hypothetical protein